MKTDLFNYHLPDELIAQSPLDSRDASRLLVVMPDRLPGVQWEDANFADLPTVLQSKLQTGPDKKGPLIIVNRSRVLPARVRVRRKTGARGEVFLLEPGKSDLAQHTCLLRPQKKLRGGEILLDEATGTTPLFKVESIDPPRVSLLDIDLTSLLSRFGEMPLPPYIVRDPGRVGIAFKDLDKERYQTIYASEGGSVASSTAGLHFTEKIMHDCITCGCSFATVTLHIGLGTFLPVTAETIDDHTMHEERYAVTHETIAQICEALATGRAILFVGTTSLRTIESIMRLAFPDKNPENGELRSHLVAEARQGALQKRLVEFADQWLATRLFIHPIGTENRPFVPACGNAILTNFHQPMSTLSMLVAGILGYQCWRQTYEHAVAAKYRFLSYGDSSLLLFHNGEKR